MLFADPVEAVPDTLRQTGGGKEKQTDTLEKDLPQLRVLLQCRGQFFPAFGYGQVGRRRHVFEITQGLRKPLRRGFAVVQVKAATVVEHDADVMAAAESVVPRQPVHQHRRFFAEHRKGLQQHLLVRAQHALGGDHRLGQLGRAGGEQELGDAVRPRASKSGLGLGSARLFKQAGETHLVASRDFAPDGNHGRFSGYHGIDGALVGRSITDKHQARLQQIADVTQLGEILGQQRIGRRHRAVGNARVHGAEGELQMLDVIA
ncbi:hypothetical protein D3C81_305360 [compost metagenome]